MSESKSTPLPWKADFEFGEWFLESREIYGVADIIADGMSEEDAKLAALAVNSHSELLASLKELREMVAFYSTPGTLEALARADAAIARATQENR